MTLNNLPNKTPQSLQLYICQWVRNSAVRCRTFANDANLGPLSGHIASTCSKTFITIDTHKHTSSAKRQEWHYWALMSLMMLLLLVSAELNSASFLTSSSSFFISSFALLSACSAQANVSKCKGAQSMKEGKNGTTKKVSNYMWVQSRWRFHCTRGGISVDSPPFDSSLRMIGFLIDVASCCISHYW